VRKVAVIGGGPAGMMAAVSAARSGANVTLLEKNEKLGKKLYITGKGRCNLTNRCGLPDFFDNIVSNRRFLYSSIYGFTNEDTWEFFEREGLKLKEERGMRVFPASDRSSDVIKTLEKALRQSGVRIRLHTEVSSVAAQDERILITFAGGGSDEYDAAVIATGGLSYASTGSTGDGYRFAESFGHDITEPVPALCPLKVSEPWVKELEGLSLRNIRIRITPAGREEAKKGKSRELFTDFGEMLFTSDGVSGPVILSASSVIARRLAAEPGSLRLSIDLKPALDEKQLDARILRDFEGEKNKAFRNSLGKLLPAKLIPVAVRLSGIDGNKQVNEITRSEREGLVSLLKGFELTLEESGGFPQAVITQGGVSVKKIDPSTLESRLTGGIFFAGEVMDVDAFTGGFNIQIALSTGFLAGKSAAEKQI